MDQEARGQRKTRKRFDPYQIAIHGLLVVLAATVVGLTHENRELRQPPASEKAQLEAGDTVAAFPAFDLEGGERLVDFAEGDRDSLVFVFTTVCPACRENQTNWSTLFEHASERYDILGISLNDLEATTEYREANTLPYPVVIPEDIRGFAMAHKIDRVPLTLVVDRRGKVRDSWLGVLNEDSLARLAAPAAAEG